MGDDDIQYFGNVRAFYCDYIQYGGKCNCATADEISLECGCMLMILFSSIHCSHVTTPICWKLCDGYFEFYLNLQFKVHRDTRWQK